MTTTAAPALRHHRHCAQPREQLVRGSLGDMLERCMTCRAQRVVPSEDEPAPKPKPKPRSRYTVPCSTCEHPLPVDSPKPIVKRCPPCAAAYRKTLNRKDD